jgi:hypothetical protein
MATRRAIETLPPQNEIIGEELRSAYLEWAKSTGREQRQVRLPACSQIKFYRIDTGIHIYMSEEAVSGNMQTDAAAFEGWALCLHLWLKCPLIVLHWTRPGRKDGKLGRHYARFLYRAQRFAELFPWFRISTLDHLADCRVRSGDPLFLNVAGRDEKESDNLKEEALMERGLVRQHQTVLLEALALDAVDRQFPVGLYGTEDLKEPVFTGGTSAIDIVGIDDDRFTLIELKACKNIKVGAISEVFFYAAMIRDAAAGRFCFGGREGSVSRMRDVSPDHAKSAKRVRAVLMAPRFHPLLEHPDLIPKLNEAARSQSGLVPLSFEQWKIDYRPDRAAPPKFEQVA